MLIIFNCDLKLLSYLSRFLKFFFSRFCWSPNLRVLEADARQRANDNLAVNIFTVHMLGYHNRRHCSSRLTGAGGWSMDGDWAQPCVLKQVPVGRSLSGGQLRRTLSVGAGSRRSVARPGAVSSRTPVRRRSAFAPSPSGSCQTSSRSYNTGLLHVTSQCRRRSVVK